MTDLYARPLIADITALALAFSALKDALTADDVARLDAALERIIIIARAAHTKIANHPTRLDE